MEECGEINTVAGACNEGRRLLLFGSYRSPRIRSPVGLLAGTIIGNTDKASWTGEGAVRHPDSRHPAVPDEHREGKICSAGREGYSLSPGRPNCIEARLSVSSRGGSMGLSMQSSYFRRKMCSESSSPT
jgi:hypothetical protein